MPTIILEKDVKKRAFEIFQERSADNGSDLDDWLKAEAELLGNSKKAPAVKKPVKKK